MFQTLDSGEKKEITLTVYITVDAKQFTGSTSCAAHLSFMQVEEDVCFIPKWGKKSLNVPLEAVQTHLESIVTQHKGSNKERAALCSPPLLLSRSKMKHPSEQRSHGLQRAQERSSQLCTQFNSICYFTVCRKSPRQKNGPTASPESFYHFFSSLYLQSFVYYSEEQFSFCLLITLNQGHEDLIYVQT